MIIRLLLVKLLQPLLVRLMRPLLVRLVVIVGPVVAVTSFVAGALAAWLLLRRRGQRRHEELARVERELASQRARAMQAERRLAQQAAAPPAFGRGVVTTGGFVSVEALAAEAEAAAAQWDATADAQALDELLIETELPLAEVEVLQAALEADQTGQEPVEIDMAALASRSGAVDPLVGGTESVEDDLVLVNGIGPVFAARLRQHGIVTFARLAETDETALAEIIQAPGWRRPDFAAWIAESTQLAAQRGSAAP